MTKRQPVSILENTFHDAQKVTQEDLQIEQAHNDGKFSSIIQNHFGSGILLSQITQNILFNSDELNLTQISLVASNDFDGTGISPTIQPSDSNLGNQLEVELSNSNVFGRLSVKVLIIGLDFQGNIQYDRLTFHRNEKQVTSKHYTNIISLFFNDFKGNNSCSRLLNGTIIIREAASMQLSRNAIMVAQDVQPNLFFRDFKIADPVNNTLFTTLQIGIGSSYTVDSLNITTTDKIDRVLSANDVTSQIGQKFLATINNIQKITLLLGVQKDDLATTENWFNWAGDLVISLYSLQKTVDCPSDIVPNLAVDFDPEFVPLVQLSFNQQTLRDAGIVLTNILQPVDFVLSSTKVSSTTNPVIVPGEFYAVTIKRSGAATNGTLFTAVGSDKITNSRVTLFNDVWLDVPEEDMWFQIWTDAAKIADGQAYDSGIGVELNKTGIDPDTGAVIDYQSINHPFADSSSNILNIGVIQAVENQSSPTQDERTGSPVFSRQQFVPSFSFVNEINLLDLKKVSEPLIIGSGKDINPKQNPNLIKIQELPGLVKGNNFCIVNPDPDLLSLNLVGSKLIPNISAGFEYRIFKSTICTDGYGDVNADGYINSADIARASQLLGESLLLSSTQTKIINGTISSLEIKRADVDGDGYVTVNDVNLITAYVNRSINSFPVGSSFTRLCLQVQNSIGRNDGYYDCGECCVRLDGYGGLNIVNASSLTLTELIYDGYQGTISIDGADPAFTTTPFVPVTFEIVSQPFWQDYFLIFDSKARQVPASFTYDEGIPKIDCVTPLINVCNDRADVGVSTDPGRNDFFVPDNLVIGKGEILRPDGSSFPVDFEVAHIILELPQIPLTEASINIFDKFVVDRGDGLTVAGLKCLRFSDCTTVKNTAINNNQIRFGVAIQSFVPNLDGYTELDGYTLIVDDIIGIYMDGTTGILKLSIKDLSVDSLYMTLVTKIQITVYLKKAGFENQTLIITPDLIAGLIST